MGKPLKAIPQVVTGDRMLQNILSSIKYVIDIREGRGTAGDGKKWVTFDDLWAAIKDVEDKRVSSLLLYETLLAKEDLKAGEFVSIVLVEDAVVHEDMTVEVVYIPKLQKAVINEDNIYICNGYVKQDYNKNAVATVYYNGINTAYSGFTGLKTGSVVYTSGTAGQCSESRNNIYQMVGMVVKSGILFVPGDVVHDCCVDV